MGLRPFTGLAALQWLPVRVKSLHMGEVNLFVACCHLVCFGYCGEKVLVGAAKVQLI